MDSALPGDSLLIEDDFNEFAAAVSEVADGSDDDPRVSVVGMLLSLICIRDKMMSPEAS